MTLRHLLLAGGAAIALAACGGGDNADGASAAKPSNASAAKVNAASPLDKPFKLANAEELDVDALFAFIPEDERPTYEKASFDKKLGATVITNLRFTGEEGDDAEFDGLLIERAELYGVNKDTIEKVRAAEEASFDAPMETLFEKVRLFGITADVEGDAEAGSGDFKIGAVEFDKLRVRPSNADAASEANPAAVAFNSFDIGGVYLKDAEMKAGVEDAADFSFALPDMRIVGFGGGKLGAIIMNDMSYSMTQPTEALEGLMETAGPQGALILNSPLKNFIMPGNQAGKMKSFVWRDVDVSGLLEYGLKGERPPLDAKNLINLGSISASDAETSINGKPFSKIAETNVSDMKFTWLAPSKVRSESKGGVYDFTAYMQDGDEEVTKLLKSHGLDNVKADSSFSYDWDAEKGDAVMQTDFDAPALADMAFGFAFEGLKLADIQQAMADGGENAALSVGEFSSMELVIDDEKMLDAIFDLSAMQSGSDGATLRKSVPLMLQMGGMQFAAMNPRINGYISALSGFLEKGGKLSISAKPDKPVAFGDIAVAGQSGPQTLPDVLNLEVEHSTK